MVFPQRQALAGYDFVTYVTKQFISASGEPLADSDFVTT